MRSPPSVYLAGPDVFLPGALAVGDLKKEICARYGLAGLFPFDNEAVATADGPPLERLIYRGNVAMMRAADAAVFNLSPFRGPSADAGTAFELGFMTALGKPCLGHTGCPSSYRDRVAAHMPLVLDRPTGRWLDPRDHAVEDFGQADNLMLTVSLSDGAPGAGILRGEAQDLSDMAGFEACVARLAEHFGTGPRR